MALLCASLALRSATVTIWETPALDPQTSRRRRTCQIERQLSDRSADSGRQLASRGQGLPRQPDPSCEACSHRASQLRTKQRRLRSALIHGLQRHPREASFAAVPSTTGARRRRGTSRSQEQDAQTDESRSLDPVQDRSTDPETGQHRAERDRARSPWRCLSAIANGPRGARCTTCRPKPGQNEAKARLLAEPSTPVRFELTRPKDIH